MKMMKNILKKGCVATALIFLLCGLTACGKTEENRPEKTEVELSKVVSAIKEAYGEDYLPNTDVDSEMLANTYGLTEDMYEEIYAQVPMISANVDTLIAVKCKEGKQEDVVTALKAYQNYLIEDSMQYPTNAVKVQASRIIEKDGYVFFVMLGVIPMDVEEQGEQAILKKAQDNNDIAQGVIDSFFS